MSYIKIKSKIFILWIILSFFVIAILLTEIQNQQNNPESQIPIRKIHYKLVADGTNDTQINIDIGAMMEAFADVFWDFDNDSGGRGLLVEGWDYFPVLGSKSATTLQLIFILAFAGGGYIISQKYL